MQTNGAKETGSSANGHYKEPGIGVSCRGDDVCLRGAPLQVVAGIAGWQQRNWETRQVGVQG